MYTHHERLMLEAGDTIWDKQISWVFSDIPSQRNKLRINENTAENKCSRNPKSFTLLYMLVLCKTYNKPEEENKYL